MRRQLLILTVTLAIAATPALADGKQGAMIGASVGASFYDINNLDGNDVQLDESDFAWKVFLGYRFGLFAVEADYRDFGTIQDAAGGQTFEFSTQSFNLSGAAMIPIGPFDLIARLGISGWDANPEVNGVELPTSLDGTDVMYGIGGAFRLGRFAIRIEIERFDYDPEPVDMASVGFSFTF